MANNDFHIKYFKNLCSDTEKFAVSPNSSGTLKLWFTSQEFPQMLEAGNPTSKEKKGSSEIYFCR